MNNTTIKLTGLAFLFVLPTSLLAEEVATLVQPYSDVTFSESMGFSGEEHNFRNKLKSRKLKKKKKHPIVKFCEKLYEKNKFSNIESKEQPLIPKIVHLIWVGPKMPPPVFEKCLAQINKHLPDWECKIWTDANVSDLKLINQQYYDEETNYGAKADILRLELLNQYGGVYIDVDYLILQPLDILHHTYEFYVGLHPASTDDVLGNAVIGAAPGHPIIKNAIDTIKDHRDRVAIVYRTGPGHLQEAFFTVAQERIDERIIALPKSFLFPLDPEDKHVSYDNAAEFIKAESFGMHFWTSTWDKKDSERADGGYEFLAKLQKTLQVPQ